MEADQESMSNQRDEVRRRFEHVWRCHNEYDAEAIFDRDIWPPGEGETGAALDRDKVRAWLENQAELAGMREADIPVLLDHFDRDHPPPEPILPLCAWGHQADLVECSPDGWYVGCSECDTVGPIRPTKTAAIEAWSYPQKLAHQQGQVDAMKETMAHPDDTDAAAAELRRLRETKP